MIPSTVVSLAPTPRDVVRREGRSRLLRFRPADQVARVGSRPPLLLIPSMINRWYVLDLRSGASLVEALVEAGHAVYCLDWGVPQDEDRYLDWDRAVARVRRAVRWTLRDSGAERLGLLGYCMGATLAALSGINSISGPGMLDFESCQSLEKLVLDNEICAMTQRLIRGIEPREDFPAAPIFEELLREKHLLIADHTRRHLREEIVFPGPVVNRANLSR